MYGQDRESVTSRARAMYLERSEAEALVRRYTSECAVFRDAVNRSKDPEHMKVFEDAEKRLAAANKKLSAVLEHQRKHGEPLSDAPPTPEGLGPKVLATTGRPQNLDRTT